MPKGTPQLRLTPILLRELRRKAKKGKTRKATLLVRKWINCAMRGGRGDSAYLREIINRTDGVAPQTIHLTGEMRSVTVNLHSFDFTALARVLADQQAQPQQLQHGQQLLTDGRAA